MKKVILALVLALAWLTLLCACASSGPDVSEKAEPSATPLPEEMLTPEPVEETQEPEPSFSFAAFHNDNSAAHAQEVRYGEHEELRELYELAAEIGNRYGVYLYIADLVPEEIMEDGNERQCDPALVRQALTEIDRVLAVYPEGFFDQLVYGDVTALEIYVVGFSPVGTGYTCLNSVGGRFVACLCLDAEESGLIESFPYLLPHELTHLIDFRFAALARLDPDCPFSEEAWTALNPPGFAYAYEDNDKELEMYDRFPEYFSYSYGAHDPLEDRATLFGDLISCYLLDNYGLGLGRGALDKMEYYLACLRGGFDTRLWPEQTPWEYAWARLSGIEAAA